MKSKFEKILLAIRTTRYQIIYIVALVGNLFCLPIQKFYLSWASGQVLLANPGSFVIRNNFLSLCSFSEKNRLKFDKTKTKGLLCRPCQRQDWQLGSSCGRHFNFKLRKKTVGNLLWLWSYFDHQNLFLKEKPWLYKFVLFYYIRSVESERVARAQFNVAGVGARCFYKSNKVTIINIWKTNTKHELISMTYYHHNFYSSGNKLHPSAHTLQQVHEGLEVVFGLSKNHTLHSIYIYLHTDNLWADKTKIELIARNLSF